MELLYRGSTAPITGGYSTENSPAIFIRGGEPWLMSYCWPTPKCRNLCVPPTFFEGKKAGETCARKSTSSTLKEIRQWYPGVLCVRGMARQDRQHRRMSRRVSMCAQ